MPTAPARPCPTPGCAQRLPCPMHPKETRIVRRTPKAVRAWYHLARWRVGRRPQVLAEQPFCVECRKEGRIEESTEVDHIVPHNGDPGLFWDPENLQGLCTSHHSQKTQREQSGGRGRPIARGVRARVGADRTGRSEAGVRSR